ncbi:hypothetical protein HMPREF0765_2436 [Sphingobacterium spiritivorum ATCC 33300]|uniref:PGAP2IP C-terminal nuclease-like domain-containing protein n=1 Tax=Sphingobacterium spiritivorum ATCC 33300 TaxID=525372 RepID=C2FYN0_SPHSI|nr:endonuclease/exonuclease/phosphatase family protein [Sphingobacterium spiritivorum]EEI91976.1 hypothetical protein HMPREF0765_2436 [Sphingobacterium spiritivorum ATCC 33300]QQS96483.1 endonuclease/exonuclease/phosphatase family protein [Sphingobacterium spiritivorum]
MKSNTILYGLLSLFILVSLSSCRKSYSAGDWDILPEKETPNPIDSGSNAPTKTLKVMSVNMRLSTIPDFATMITYIKEYSPDLLFLRQIDSATTRVEKVNRPQVMADSLGMEVFFKKNFDYQTGGFGNAVLSKFPIKEKVAQILRREDGNTAELRSAVMIRVEVEKDHDVYFAGTELDPSVVNNRNLQVVDLLNMTEKITEPVILVGNFNEQESANGQVLSYLKGSFTFACLGAGCPMNSPKASPTGIYDYITFKGAGGKLALSNYLAFPKSANTFLPMTASFKLKIEQ